MDRIKPDVGTRDRMRSALAGLTVAVLPVMAGHARASQQPAPPSRLSIGQVQTLTLDGDLSDWPADHASFVLGQISDTQSRAERWTGSPDLAAKIHMAWSDEGLYFAANVADQKLMQAATTGAEPWQGDTIELFFNSRPDQQRSDGFLQIALIPSLTAGHEVQAISPQGPLEGIRGASGVDGAGYTIECLFPWPVIAGFTPQRNAELGLQVMIDDRDGRGRHAQLHWYPSAVTYVQPTHMNRLMLRGRADVKPVTVLGGPASSFVTTSEYVDLSVATDQPEAASVAIDIADASRHTQLTATIPLDQIGGLAVGQARVPHQLKDGQTTLRMTVLDADGQPLARRSRPLDFAGREYESMRQRIKSYQDRLDGPEFVDADEQALAGLQLWVRRCSAVAGNEARPQAVDLPLLKTLTGQLDAIEQGIDRLADGQDPYAGRTGSFVRAYRSPLTGKFRSHAIFIPPEAADNKPLPMIVLLHGIFADDRQLLFMTPDIADLGAIVYQAAAYRQFDWHDVSFAETEAGLDQVLDTYQVDADRIYLIGHHNGGRAVLQLAIRWPDRFAALAALYPGIDTRPHYPALALYPEYLPQVGRNLIPPPHGRPAQPEPSPDPVTRRMYQAMSLVPYADRIAALPLYVAAGESDPHAAAELWALVDRLASLGHPPVLKYHANAMHGSTPPELSSPAFYEWLLSHRRSPQTAPAQAADPSPPPFGSFVPKDTTLQGPIADAFRSRFIYVHGQATEEMTRKLADWGLHATFLTKLDTDITDADIAEANLVLVGRPENNAILARMADRLPLQWDDAGLRLGDQSATGELAAACVVLPNPLNPERYVLVLTGKDLNACRNAWRYRYDVDFVLIGTGDDGNPTLVTRGCFDPQWQYDKASSISGP